VTTVREFHHPGSLLATSIPGHPVILTTPSRPICATPGRLTREILISVDIAWRKINSPRCRARRPALLSVRAENVCRDIAWRRLGQEQLQTIQILATWRS